MRQNGANAFFVHTGFAQGLLGVCQMLFGVLLKIIVVQIAHRLPVFGIRAEMPGHCAHAGRHADGVLKQVLLGGGGCQKFFGTGQSEFFHGEFPSF